MKKYLSMMTIYAVTFFYASAQEVEISKKIWGNKKIATAPKKIFVSQFRVNYQLMFAQQEQTQGGQMLGGGYRGGTKVSLNLGLRGPQENHFIKLTDNLYAGFIDRLKQEGFEIVTANDLVNIDVFKGWERQKGGQLNEAQYAGYASVSPTGFEYFVPGTKKSGKEKTTFLDLENKMSKQGGGIIVLNVNIVVPFAYEAESQGSKALLKTTGGVSKVVAETTVKLSADGLVSSGWMNQSVTTTEMNVFYQASMAEQGGANFKLKKSISLPDVLEKKKYKAIEVAATDVWGTNAGLFTVFQVDDKWLKSMQPIDVDPEKYNASVGNVASEFLNKVIGEFLEGIYK